MPSLPNATGPSKYDDEESTSSFPIVAQVTTSATQAASASRRKNEAIHVCPIPGCGSTFTRKFNLNGHIRSHTGSRPYQCKAPGCGKSFARSFDLSRHEKLHAGIKPHTCESCGKAFARADALSRHLRNDAGSGGCATRFGEEDDEDEGSLGGGEGSFNDHGDGSGGLPKLAKIADGDMGGFQNQPLRAYQQPTQAPHPQHDQEPIGAAMPGSMAMWGAATRRDTRFKGQVL